MIDQAARNRPSVHLILAAALAGSLWPGIPVFAAEPPGAARATPPMGALSPATMSLEKFLDHSLRAHPEIMAAEAKVDLAQAELRQTRFQVARELITFWNEWKSQEEQVALLAPEVEAGHMGTKELIQVKARLAEIESQVPFLLGQTGGVGSEGPSPSSQSGGQDLPEGPEVEKIVAMLEESIPLEYIDTPVRDVADVIQDISQVRFIVDPLVEDVPVTIDISGVPVGAAIQALEDITPGVRFVVRDYGILVTSDSSRAAETYVSASQFWRERGAKRRPFPPEVKAVPQ
ncbi:MAG: hypothetical protein ACYTG0_09460 [Planctomycetota bacterium]|jgi:hypothetical protein